MSRMPHILITGASGFTGQSACSYFVNKGWRVTAIVRSHKPISGAPKIIQCNLTDKDAVLKLIQQENPDFILHLAGQNSVKDSWIDPIDCLEANALSTLYLLEAIRTVNPNIKMIVTGSALQFDPSKNNVPDHPYSFCKTLQAQMAQYWVSLFNLNIVIAKPSNLIGPGPSKGVCSLIAKQIVHMEPEKTKGVIALNDLSEQRDFLDVRDAIRGYDILIQSGDAGVTYDLSTGISQSLHDITQHFRKLTNVPFEIQTKKPLSHHPPVQINSEKIRELGWEPKLSISTSLLDTIQYFRDVE